MIVDYKSRLRQPKFESGISSSSQVSTGIAHRGANISKLFKSRRSCITILAIISFIIIIGAVLMPHIAVSKEKVNLVQVTVEEGDTIWKIAQVYTPHGDDVRELVYYIKQLNSLTSAQIYPGQVILIPLMDA